jgi:hypothetical protein
LRDHGQTSSSFQSLAADGDAKNANGAINGAINGTIDGAINGTVDEPINIPHNDCTAAHNACQCVWRIGIVGTPAGERDGRGVLLP